MVYFYYSFFFIPCEVYNPVQRVPRTSGSLVFIRSTVQVCVLVVLMSWVACAGLHASVYLPTPHFYFNHLGNHTCEPFHTLNYKIIMLACIVYFPATMVSPLIHTSAYHPGYNELFSVYYRQSFQ